MAEGIFAADDRRPDMPANTRRSLKTQMFTID
jgi:hypothetical protein